MLLWLHYISNYMTFHQVQTHNRTFWRHCFLLYCRLYWYTNIEISRGRGQDVESQEQMYISTEKCQVFTHWRLLERGVQE